MATHLLWSNIWLFNFKKNGCMKLHNNKKISFLWEIFQNKNTNEKNNNKNIQKKRKKHKMTPGLMEEGSWKGKHKHKE